MTSTKYISSQTWLARARSLSFAMDWYVLNQVSVG